MPVLYVCVHDLHMCALCICVCACVTDTGVEVQRAAVWGCSRQDHPLCPVSWSCALCRPCVLSGGSGKELLVHAAGYDSCAMHRNETWLMSIHLQDLDFQRHFVLVNLA